MTGGWQNSDMIVIAARPSMGKTALSLAVTSNAALHPDKPTGVAYFSLEMSAQQLAQRLLTSEARVDAQAARTGRLHDDDWPKLARAAGRLSAAQIFIDDTPGLGILELRAKCRRLKAEHNIGLVIVDYLQLMHGTSQTKGSNREQEIAQISRSLKGLAKELNVPVLALSQLSRAVESRPDKRPQLSDLRESGSIEQDADVVMFIYRAERYGITVDDQGNSTEGLGELIIGKQRNGPIGNAKVAFVNQFARFENLTSYVQSDPYGGDPFSGGGYGGGPDPYGDAPYGGGDGSGPPPLPPPATDAPF
jgi:replicative DNA helicase